MEYNKIRLLPDEGDNVLRVGLLRTVFFSDKGSIINTTNEILATPQPSGEFKLRAIRLNKKYDWVIAQGKDDELLCVPVKKGDIIGKK